MQPCLMKPTVIRFRMEILPSGLDL
uniref:Uncharacterized protein n=1 Tax=Arundo donax TaxID=35708 RepID=A0A0A9B3A5_ARUDO